MLQQPKLNVATILLLLTVAIATVASVPTSVLVQNSEMASNANNNNRNNNNLNNLKVKRSSNNIKESASSAAAALNKKSSPETVPASFNAPPPEPVSSSSSSSSAQSSSAGSLNLAAAGLLPSNGDIINSAIAAGLTAAAVEAAAAASQRELEQQQQQQQYADEYGLREDETPTLLRKRGINSQQYLYGSGGAPGLGGGYGYNYGNTDFYNVPLLAASTSGSSPSSQSATPVGMGIAGVPNGVWTDEIDPPVVYTDLQEFDDYAPRAPYHNKAYDNLQNILNSETYLEPVALPLQYTGRYYGADADRKKRSNLNKYNKFPDMRLKRDTKLTPADMLALVALVEAGERARNDADVENAAANSYVTYPDAYDYNNNNAGRNGYYSGASPYDYQPNVNSNSNNNNNLDDVIGEYNGAWLEPAVVDYYGVPYNVEALPKYELQPLAPREHKYSGQNRYATKRFMVSKKKRSLGQYMNEPLAKSSYSSYSGGNGEKYF